VAVPAGTTGSGLVGTHRHASPRPDDVVGVAVASRSMPRRSRSTDLLFIVYAQKLISKPALRTRRGAIDGPITRRRGAAQKRFIEGHGLDEFPKHRYQFPCPEKPNRTFLLSRSPLRRQLGAGRARSPKSRVVVVTGQRPPRSAPMPQQHEIHRQSRWNAYTVCSLSRPLLGSWNKQIRKKAGQSVVKSPSLDPGNAL